MPWFGSFHVLIYSVTFFAFFTFIMKLSDNALTVYLILVF